MQIIIKNSNAINKKKKERKILNSKLYKKP